jgi:2-amino-4-hydroxy-6-hydroxymethyldihydropteridine diphosphokinase
MANNTYFLLLGGNEANTLELFEKAKQLLSKEGDVVQESKIYQSKAWGYESDKLFLNQAIKFISALLPEELLQKIHTTEHQLGRTRKNDGYADRGIDIDILLYNNEMFKTELLEIPHPHLHKRAFALAPLNDLYTDYQHPKLKKVIRELYFKVKDDTVVKIDT